MPRPDRGWRTDHAGARRRPYRDDPRLAWLTYRRAGCAIRPWVLCLCATGHDDTPLETWTLPKLADATAKAAAVEAARAVTAPWDTRQETPA